MGICLDTEQSNNQQNNQIPWIRRNNSVVSIQSLSTTLDQPKMSKAQIGNLSGINFSVPRTPVIFLLGGPGSGKIYHCQQLAARVPGVVHLNMSDLLLQHAGRHGIRDAEGVPAAALVGVVMLEINMSPEARVFVVSGYPRHMEDLMEYTQKIVRIDGAILIDWKEKSLRRQIEYGAQLGEIDLDIAKRELKLFEKKVLPVCQYLSTKRLLKVVDGERNPSEVYDDVVKTCELLLGSSLYNDNSNNELDDKEPGDDVRSRGRPVGNVPNDGMISIGNHKDGGKTASDWIGPVIFVIGGPGSNKSRLCEQVAPLFPGWIHIPLGRILRMLSEVRGTVPAAYAKSSFIRQPLTPDALIAMHGLIARGELVSQDVCLHVLVSSMLQFPEADGFIVDGYPRDAIQARDFEEKFNEPITAILVDCSELELGRNLGRRSGRPDDSLQASRRRLQLYQTVTLPMLKELDDEGRLICIDGDADEDNLLRELKRQMHLEMQRLQKDNTEWAFLNKDGNQMNNNHPSKTRSRLASTTDSLDIELSKLSNKHAAGQQDKSIQQHLKGQNQKLAKTGNQEVMRRKSIAAEKAMPTEKRKLQNGALIIANVANDLSVS